MYSAFLAPATHTQPLASPWVVFSFPFLSEQLFFTWTARSSAFVILGFSATGRNPNLNMDWWEEQAHRLPAHKLRIRKQTSVIFFLWFPFIISPPSFTLCQAPGQTFYFYVSVTKHRLLHYAPPHFASQKAGAWGSCDCHLCSALPRAYVRSCCPQRIK